jgi:site-specific recombinase XerD
MKEKDVTNSSNWRCSVCLHQYKAWYTGKVPKQTITIALPWTDHRPMVRQGGENRYPCPHPDCEGARITHWDNIEDRMFSRLRTHAKIHCTREETITIDHRLANQLRCQLLCGPPDCRPPDVKLRDVYRQPVGKQDGGETSGISNMRQGVVKKKDKTTVVSVHKKMKQMSAMSENKDIPEHYQQYLVEESGLKEKTISQYQNVVRKYLGWLDLEKQTSDLVEFWNIDWLQEFMCEIRSNGAKATTIYNYHCAATNVQRYLQRSGLATPSDRQQNHFTFLMKTASKMKREHQKVAKQEQVRNTPKLSQVNEFVIKNENHADLFKCIVKKCQDHKLPSHFVNILTNFEFKWATAFAIMQLQSSNFKRNGNLVKIQKDYAEKKINRNLKKCRLLEESHEDVEPPSCILSVNDGVKNHNMEMFCINEKYKKNVLRLYIKYIRPNCPKKPSCTELFINTNGKSLFNKVHDYLNLLGKTSGLKKMTIANCRTQLETSAAEFSGDVDRAEISRHLSHTEDTRNRYYLGTTNKTSSKASKDIDK